MTVVSIIGTGAMGSAIASVVQSGGNTAELFGSGDSGRQVTGEVVVLAVPYAAIPDVIAQRGEQLAGKVVVDISNPVNLSTFDSLVVPADSSATAQVAANLPASRVIKAFNTNFAATLSSGTVGELPTTVLVAGDDEDAKALLADVVVTGGLQVIDAGSLSRARELEAFGFLQIVQAAAGKVSWTGGFAAVS